MSIQVSGFKSRFDPETSYSDSEVRLKYTLELETCVFLCHRHKMTNNDTIQLDALFEKYLVTTT